MLYHTSPWVYELPKRNRYELKEKTLDTEILIIGAGIAGIITAYYILSLTDKDVTVVEENEIASGASGYNAGQLTSYFERPFEDIVAEYGEKMAVEGQEEVNTAWSLLNEIKQQVNLKTPVHVFQGLSGCISVQPVYTHLQNNYFRPSNARREESCFIAEDSPFLSAIPSVFKDLYTQVPRKVILDLLETTDNNYSAAFTSQKGTMNSALFCEEIVTYLQNFYATRFSIYEKTKVLQVNLEKNSALVKIDQNKEVTAQKIVLCTNGFKNLKIRNNAGKTINTQFHETILSKIAFMKAYVRKDHRFPTAISYYPQKNDSYFYLTRRAWTKGRTITAIGGPEFFLKKKAIYTRTKPYPEKISQEIDAFTKILGANKQEKTEDVFMWHGLMGYTKTGLRMIGPDRYNPTLLYNTGCNGVGILPSIFGGKKIAHVLRNEIHKKSIFDPYI